jgi:hypothetical protein
MSNGIPTAKTYLLFMLKFYVIAFAAYLLCVALFMAGRPILGWLVILACVYLYWRSGRELIRRAKRGIRRTDGPATALPEQSTRPREEP